MCVQNDQCNEGLLRGIYVGVPRTPAQCPPGPAQEIPHPPPPIPPTGPFGEVLVSGPEPECPPWLPQLCVCVCVCACVCLCVCVCACVCLCVPPVPPGSGSRSSRVVEVSCLLVGWVVQQLVPGSRPCGTRYCRRLGCGLFLPLATDIMVSLVPVCV